MNLSPEDAQLSIKICVNFLENISIENYSVLIGGNDILFENQLNEIDE